MIFYQYLYKQIITQINHYNLAKEMLKRILKNSWLYIIIEFKPGKTFLNFLILLWVFLAF